MKQGKVEPMISVLMGVYCSGERSGLLQRSVRSILEQTYADFELLICDDGSAREARRMLEQFAVEDARVQLVRRGNLITLSAKLNECLRYARGQLIARMDDDDYSHPQRFERQVTYLQEHPEISFVGCNVNTFLEGQKKGTRVFPEFPQVKDFYMTQPYVHPALVFRKEAIMPIGGYSEETHVLLCEDYDLLLRLYARGFLGANIQEILLDYTVSKTAKGNRTMRHRFNEAITRWRRFQELGVLSHALPYVLKPIVVGMIPDPLLKKIKRICMEGKNTSSYGRDDQCNYPCL